MDSEENKNETQEQIKPEEENKDSEIQFSQIIQKDDEEELNIGSVISKIKDFDNNVFKYEHLSYQDSYIIDEIKSFNSQKNYKINSLQELFLKVIQQFAFEDINQCLFYSEVFIYLLKKTFYILKNTGPNDELINIFNTIQRFAAQIISKNIKYILQKKDSNLNLNEINSLCNIVLSQSQFVVK